MLLMCLEDHWTPLLSSWCADYLGRHCNSWETWGVQAHNDAQVRQEPANVCSNSGPEKQECFQCTDLGPPKILKLMKKPFPTAGQLHSSITEEGKGQVLLGL